MADHAETDGGQAPLDGVILCCTSIAPEKRSELASIASQMGAQHKLDLTSDVTHLIVGDVDTPKYRFVAKERPDVKCLLPGWIEALRESWLEGGKTNVVELEDRFRLPTFRDLKICVTGFDDLDFRKQLEDQVNSNGGDYRGNLTKDVTHLIAKEPTGAKYKYALEWKVKVVAVEWFFQSLERGMILDETLFSPLLLAAQRGQNAWIRNLASTHHLGKRPRDGENVSVGPRKLRRTASAKLSSQTTGMWSDIVGNEIKVEQGGTDVWADQQEYAKSRPQPSVPRSFEASLSSVNFKAEAETTSTGDLRVQRESVGAGNKRQLGIFSKCRFIIHAFNAKKTSVLYKYLISNGAEILPSLETLTSEPLSLTENEYIILPHDVPRSGITSLPQNIDQRHLVTDMWIERCLHRKMLVRPGANVTNTPFEKFPILKFKNLKVCSTRFEGVDLLHLSRAVTLMGATYDEEFTSQASVLVCNTVVASSEKLRHAHHWNVPSVKAKWLWDCIQDGEVKPYEPYLVQPFTSRISAGEAAPVMKFSESSKAQLSENTYEPADAKMQKIKPERLKTGSHNSSSSKGNDTAALSRASPSQHNAGEIPEPTDPSIAEALFFDAPTAPLGEISPNFSPKASISAASKPSLPSQDSNLGPAISTLLANVRNPKASSDLAPRPIGRHRRRQLLGRAPSNVSTGSAVLSRASSVDTENTEGLGTPLELSFPTVKEPSRNNSFDTLFRETEEEKRLEGEQQQPLMMTQLGYQDEGALRAREKVLGKMGAKGEVVRAKEIGRVRDAGVKGGGRRTRNSGGR
ncbi:MAG: hypothetical protein Q9167_003017 [Letrouitia subvulpina]